MSDLPPPSDTGGEQSNSWTTAPPGGYAPPADAGGWYGPPNVDYSQLPTGGVGATPVRQVTAADIGLHFRRVFKGGGIRSVTPTPGERARLEAGGITDPLMQGYAAWRRSLLVVAAAPAAVSGVLALVALFTDVETESFNGIGVIVQAVPFLAVVLLMITMGVALLNWDKLRKSSTILSIGWLISVAAPVLVALVPADWLVKSTYKDQLAAQGTSFLTIRILVGVGYMISLLPTILSVPSGVIRGATRIKTLVPASTISGWALMILAPLYALLFVVALVLIEQLAGNFLLLFGVILMASSPMLHVHASKLYLRPLTTEDELRSLDRVQQRAGLLSLAGMALAVIWALTTETADLRIIGTGDTAIISPYEGILRVIELIARVLITTAVFSHVLLQFTEAHWRNEREFTQDPTFAHHELQMAQVEHTLRVTGDRANT